MMKLQRPSRAAITSLLLTWMLVLLLALPCQSHRRQFIDKRQRGNEYGAEHAIDPYDPEEDFKVEVVRPIQDPMEIPWPEVEQKPKLGKTTTSATPSPPKSPGRGRDRHGKMRGNKSGTNSDGERQHRKSKSDSDFTGERRNKNRKRIQAAKESIVPATTTTSTTTTTTTTTEPTTTSTTTTTTTTEPTTTSTTTEPTTTEPTTEPPTTSTTTELTSSTTVPTTTTTESTSTSTLTSAPSTSPAPSPIEIKCSPTSTQDETGKVNKTTPTWDTNDVIIEIPNNNCDSEWFLDSKVELIKTALKKGDLKRAHYFLAKIDESPKASQLLQSIIQENYTLELFNDTMLFIQGIFNSTLKLEGYKALLQNLIADDGFSTTSRQELFTLAYQLKRDAESGNFDPDQFRNFTNHFSQGIKSVVFDPFFRIKNIHDSYVFHYKAPGGSYYNSDHDQGQGHGHGNGNGNGNDNGDAFEGDGEYWAITGKCKNCNESELIAEPDEGYHTFTIRNRHLKGGQNCLGVKNRKVLFWVYEPHSESAADLGRSSEYFGLLCRKERWQIKFVGKTLANIIYMPKSLASIVEEWKAEKGLTEESTLGSDDFGKGSMTSSGIGLGGQDQGGPLSADNQLLRGFGITRSGYNKVVGLESTLYLNSNQIWLTT